MNAEQEKNFEAMMIRLKPEDKAALYDRYNRLRIDDVELSWPVRIGPFMGKTTITLGPLASQCENCKASSKMDPAMEGRPIEPWQKEIFDSMDAPFISMRHPNRCERRIMLASYWDPPEEPRAAAEPPA